MTTEQLINSLKNFGVLRAVITVEDFGKLTIKVGSNKSKLIVLHYLYNFIPVSYSYAVLVDKNLIKNRKKYTYDTQTIRYTGLWKFHKEKL